MGPCFCDSTGNTHGCDAHRGCSESASVSSLALNASIAERNIASCFLQISSWPDVAPLLLLCRIFTEDESVHICRNEETHPPYVNSCALWNVPGFEDEKFCLVKAPFFCFRVQHDRQPFQTNMCSNWRKNLGFDWRKTAIHFQCFDRRAQRQCRLRTDFFFRFNIYIQADTWKQSNLHRRG